MQRPQDVTIWKRICRGTALVGECQGVWSERCCTFLRQRTRWNSDLIQDGKSFVSDLSRVEMNSYFSQWLQYIPSHPTYILCLKAQNVNALEKFKNRARPSSNLLAHNLQGKTKILGLWLLQKRSLFSINDCILTLFLSAVKTNLLSWEWGTGSALCACS